MGVALGSSNHGVAFVTKLNDATSARRRRQPTKFDRALVFGRQMTDEHGATDRVLVVPGAMANNRRSQTGMDVPVSALPESGIDEQT